MSDQDLADRVWHPSIGDRVVVTAPDRWSKDKGLDIGLIGTITGPSGAPPANIRALRVRAWEVTFDELQFIEALYCTEMAKI